MNLWKISTSEQAQEEQDIMRLGNVYQLANGYMGYRGTLEEYGASQLVGNTIAGLFDQVGDAWREPVNAPNGGYVSVSLDGIKLSALGDFVKSHHLELDLLNATFSRETLFEGSEKSLRLRTKRFLSVDIPNLVAVEIRIQCEADALVSIESGIDGEIWDLNGPHLPELHYELRDRVLLCSGLTQELHREVAVAEVCDVSGLPYLKEGFGKSGRKHTRTLDFSAKAGVEYRFYKYFSVVAEQEIERGRSKVDAVAVVTKAAERGFESCLEAHCDIWESRWTESDVVIEGDNEAQLALRYSIFQLLMVAPLEGSGHSIPARALSGQVYKGAVFWDTEMFMYPFFLHTNPTVAKELLCYRIRTLEGARRKARTEGPGYRGAFYAWESQETGDDACSCFNVGDPITGRDLRTHFRDKQVHISGDIAIAMWNYYEHTDDDSLLLEGGAEVILECARFYYSYAYFKRDKNRFEILDVIGPDEYHERVNNNAFTSMVAKETFEIALKLVELLRLKHPSFLEWLLQSLEIERELSDFEDTARLLYVPQPDPITDLIEQFDGYWKLRDSSVEAVVAQKAHPNEYLGAGQGPAVPTQVIKQADVVMMLNLFKDRFSKEVKEANWRYYEPRTEHGSSLSACAHAMVALDFGESDFAYRYFLKTAKVDLEGKYKLYAGTIFIGGSHPAANGGAWMTAVFGFGGVRASADQLRIVPRLYDKWKRLQFPIRYKGDQFVITLTHEEATVSCSPKNLRSHEIYVSGENITCSPGRKIVVQLRAQNSKVSCN